MPSAHRYSWERVDGSTGQAWRAKWIGADGRPAAKKGFRRERDAFGYAQDREVEARHGVVLDEQDEQPSGRITVKAWSQRWLEGLDVRDSSRETYEQRLKRILPHLGGRTLVSLRPSEIRAWRRGLTVGDGALADSTADAVANVLAMMLRAAVEDGLIRKSPMPSGRGGRRRDSARIVEPDELLTLEQVRAWAAKMPEVCREMPLVAATTGLRQGELFALRVDDVDFLRRRLRIHPERGQLVKAQWAPPKTPKSARTVPLGDVTIDALNRHLQRQPAVEGEPIFRGRRFGQRWSRSSFWKVWETARASAKLPDWVHWHSLRDVAASTWIRQGLDVKAVMELMGHTSAEETLRTYAKLWPDHEDRAREAVDAAWSVTAEGHGRATKR